MKHKALTLLNSYTGERLIMQRDTQGHMTYGYYCMGEDGLFHGIAPITKKQFTDKLVNMPTYQAAAYITVNGKITKEIKNIHTLQKQIVDY